ncbi:MAG: flagellin [Candidatus Omnitrophota bacterium]
MSVSRIVNNISAINASRNLDKTGRNLSKSIERLSSGLRINRAGDDAAGMSVANRLRTQVQGLDQAVTNASDGINLINVAEGALDETTSRLNRIRTLAIQSANTSVNDQKARLAIQDEVFQNIDEITRIAQTTRYGGSYLLNGDFSIQTENIEGQEEVGIEIDASPVASTLVNGKSFLNIIRTQNATSQIVAGDAVGANQVMNTGIRNQTDIAVSLAMFSQGRNFTGAAVVTTDTVASGLYLNGVSVYANDVIMFSGVLADGVTKFSGALTLAATSALGTAAGASSENPQDIIAAINRAIDNAEVALFGVPTAASVPTAYRTTVTLGGAASDNRGRLMLYNEGNYINQSSIDMTIFRSGNLITRSNGVTRSGAIGMDSALTGGGQVGNAVTAITGSTFQAGQFSIEVKDVQSAQQKRVESTVKFLDGNGARIVRTTTLGGTVQNNTLVINGSFVENVYTGGQTLRDNDVIVLKGTNADGTTFEGRFTYVDPATNVELQEADTDFNDFEFSTISGLIQEMNYRSRDYVAGAGVTDGVQTRFEDALFTYTPTGTLMLVDDIGRSNSEMTFTLTFQNRTDATPTEYYTIQDDGVMTLEGFAEQATFSVNGGEAVRAEAGDTVTLYGPQATKEGIPQSQVTFRVGNNFTSGTDKLETTPAEFRGTLNGGAAVDFRAGDQDVVFVDGNSGGNKGPSRFVTVDFDSIVDVTKRTDGLPDAGRTIVVSTSNSSLNFQIGAFADQNFKMAIGDMTAENLGFGRGSGRAVANINVSTLTGANEAIRILDEALSQVDKTRSILGSSTNRLEAAINNMSVSYENLQSSESRIRDADLTRETTAFTKNQVLQQAGISVLAQANFQSQGFLSLLG